MRRALIALLATISVLVGTYSGYALFTRIGEPSFSRGGEFGAAAETGSPSSSGGARTRVLGTRAARPPATAVASAAPAAPHPSPPRAASGSGAGVTLMPPRTGTYTFDGSGSERIEFGGASRCAWNIGSVPLTVKRSGADTVFDWDYEPRHQERNIVRYRDDGVYTSFVGAAVTCLGVRNEDESTYDPPALRVRLPLETGARWTTTAKANGRTESIRGRVVDRKRVTVPAGTFDAFVVRVEVEMTGDTAGTFSAELWYAPAAGIAIYHRNRTDVVKHGARFVGDVTLRLRALP